MATYVIGDLQGCFSSLLRLLEKLEFSPSFDRVWFVGDLVSRGEQSLQTLRYIKSLGKSAVCVLGNHDVSLIAAAYGVAPLHKSLKPLAAAWDFAELVDWLRQQPLLHHDRDLKAVMVHAGLPPGWDLTTAKECAGEAEQSLRQPDPTAWLASIYGNKPNRWKPARLTPVERQCFTINALTRMRFCHADGALDFKQKASPAVVNQSHPELIPWFLHPKRPVLQETIYTGHWSTLGYYNQPGVVVALDTGCIWGGHLTAFRIDSPQAEIYQVECSQNSWKGK